MPKFSQRSLDNLSTCDHHLQILFNEVIKLFDCAVVCGHRDKEAQTEAFVSGKSKLGWPLSKHNTKPSKAVDVIPCINGKPSYDPDNCRMFAGKVLGMAAIMNMQGKIISGADWDDDGECKDQKLQDPNHFEIKDKP